MPNLVERKAAISGRVGRLLTPAGNAPHAGRPQGSHGGLVNDDLAAREARYSIRPRR